MLIGHSDASITPVTMNQHITNDDFLYKLKLVPYIDCAIWQILNRKVKKRYVHTKQTEAECYISSL